MLWKWKTQGRVTAFFFKIFVSPWAFYYLCRVMMNDIYSLYQINGFVRQVVEERMNELFRVQAEISEIRISQKGACFLELVDRESEGEGKICAKARAVIMRQGFPLIRMQFEQATGQPLAAGIKVLMEVTVSFDECYGYSLVIHDIDPAYTMGEMALHRKRILERLEKEGVLDMNRSLEIPVLIQRIAIVSSPTAAGYEDFCRQLEENEWGFRFDYRLFPATMQGEETEKSVIAALDSIASQMEEWDVVVIIRGGGAVSDLNSFDSYALANNCAQFPLPVFTGIGHERDSSVLDEVAALHFKTPTAVAAFLIDHMRQQADRIQYLYDSLQEAALRKMEEKRDRLKRLSRALETIGPSFLPQRNALLQRLSESIFTAAKHRTDLEQLKMDNRSHYLQQCVEKVLNNRKQQLELLSVAIDKNNPLRILQLGYSLTRCNGHLLTDIEGIQPGDVLETQLFKGRLKSRVEDVDASS